MIVRNNTVEKGIRNEDSRNNSFRILISLLVCLKQPVGKEGENTRVIRGQKNPGGGKKGGEIGIRKRGDR